MSIPQQYIQGFIIPTLFGDEAQKSFIRQWTMQHSEEHLNLYGLLGELENTLGLVPLKFDTFHLSFEPGDLRSINDFIYYDNFQHEELYNWINTLGAYLTNYNKPILTVLPRLNPMIRMLDANTGAFNMFFLMEKNVHANIQVAVNSLYQAYGVS
jgi:hypothetical protein